MHTKNHTFIGTSPPMNDHLRERGKKEEKKSANHHSQPMILSVKSLETENQVQI